MVHLWTRSCIYKMNLMCEDKKKQSSLICSNKRLKNFTRVMSKFPFVLYSYLLFNRFVKNTQLVSILYSKNFMEWGFNFSRKKWKKCFLVYITFKNSYYNQFDDSLVKIQKLINCVNLANIFIDTFFKPNTVLYNFVNFSE